MKESEVQRSWVSCLNSYNTESQSQVVLFQSLSTVRVFSRVILVFYQNPALWSPGFCKLPGHLAVQGPRMLFCQKRGTQNTFGEGSTKNALVCRYNTGHSSIFQTHSWANQQRVLIHLSNSTKDRERLSNLLRVTQGFSGETGSTT